MASMLSDILQLVAIGGGVLGCLFMIGAALVLVIARPRMARAAAIQGVLPLLALLAALIW